MDTVELEDRVLELEEHAQRFVLATSGAEGWENHFQMLLMQERKYFNRLLAEVIAQLQRGIIAEAKALLDQAFATRVRGTYQAGTNYVRGDIVALNGASFLAKSDSPGVCPGERWQMIAAQGRRGVRGERGPAGNAIAGWRVDRQRYMLVPVMSDGSHGPPLELRDLFQQFLTDAEL
jgi:hypothetical protein